MSTSLLYHGFGIQGYQYKRTQYDGGAVTFTISQEQSEYRCPVCRSRRVMRKGLVPRRFRTLPIGGKPVFVLLSAYSGESGHSFRFKPASQSGHSGHPSERSDAGLLIIQIKALSNQVRILPQSPFLFLFFYLF